MRPETAALLGLDAGLLWHPNPGLQPLEVKKFAACETEIQDLVGDFVMANAVDEHGFTPKEACLPAGSIFTPGPSANGPKHRWKKSTAIPLTSRTPTNGRSRFGLNYGPANTSARADRVNVGQTHLFEH
jgi:hypothetical protein